LGFHIPKSDRCDTCEEYLCKNKPTDDEIDEHSAHTRAKKMAKKERDGDRALKQFNHACLCFDLQNVISLPRANISSYFYRRKLQCMTGHCSVGADSKGLCAVWHEAKSGRTGNDIASSVVKLLEEIVKLYPSVTDFTLWSDSCVPQNKNSVMSFALIAFLNRNSHVKSITQKFGEPGHSPVQEVHNLNSQIERKLKNKDVFSPVGLLRVLKQVNIKNRW